jgi:hypothetical protein
MLELEKDVKTIVSYTARTVGGSTSTMRMIDDWTWSLDGNPIG